MSTRYLISGSLRAALLAASMLCPSVGYCISEPPAQTITGGPYLSTVTGGSVTGTTVFGGCTPASTILSCLQVNNTIAPDQVAEKYVTRFETNMTLTANAELAVLADLHRLNINTGPYTYGAGGLQNGRHTSSLYVQTHNTNTLPVAGCTPSVDCPGSIANAVALVTYVDNNGTGPIAFASNVEIHSVAAGSPTSGASIDTWYAMHVEPCVSGRDAGMCYTMATANHLPIGVGTETPVALLHVRGTSNTGTATGSISDGTGLNAGTVLTLTTTPTNSGGICPNTLVTGSGVTTKTYITQAGVNATGLGMVLKVNNSQLVASETLTLACPDMGIYTQSTNGDASVFFGSANAGSAEPTGYITQHFDGTLGQEWRIGQSGRDSGTSIVITQHGAVATKNVTQVGIGYGDTAPAYTLDANGDINTTGSYRSSGTAGITCTGSGAGFTSLNGLVTACPAPSSGVVPATVSYTSTQGATAFAAGATFARVIVQGQGGCGGAGGGTTTPFSGAGGGGGGGSSPKDTGWFPLASVSGTYTVTIATQCTAATGATAGGNGGHGAVGGNATFTVTGMPVITSFGGGGGAGAIGGAGATATGGGGGAGTTTVGGTVTGATGGSGGGQNGVAGGSGGNGTSATGFYGASGGGGSSAAGASGVSVATVGGSTGGSSGGGCNTGTPVAASAAGVPLSTATTNGGSTGGGATGAPGGTGPAAVGFVGAGGGGGGGAGTTSGGAGGTGGAGGGGGGGGGSGCGASSTGGNGGVGGQAQVTVMTL